MKIVTILGKFWQPLIFLVNLLVIFALFACSPVKLMAAGDVFILSQVRGKENCCDPGSLANFSYQLEQLQQYNFPGAFLFRYDALLDHEFINTFLKAKKNNPHLSVGIWVEVTPKLAEDSGVHYPGAMKKWYLAEQSLLVGYNPEDRQKLLKTLLHTYYNSFPNETLQLAGAWGIDTNSLNYLHQQGVKIYQGVREQYGTDSYTVDGSITNEPYYPSVNWYLIPSKTPRDLLIIKHTISDPLHNYGDGSSSYTSQPNDYEHAQLTTKDYFLPLLLQALHPPDNRRGWAVIGLENSMSEKYQLEFKQQLQLLHQLATQDIAKVVTPNEVRERFANSKEIAGVRITSAKDLTVANQPLVGFWVETPHYRLRWRIINTKLVLTDARAYSEDYSDYYNSHRAKDGFRGIVPAIFANNLTKRFINQGFILKADNYYKKEYGQNQQNLLERLFKQNYYFLQNNFYFPERDASVNNGLFFPEIVGEIQISGDNNEQILQYTSRQQQTVQLTFLPKTWKSNTKPITLTNQQALPQLIKSEQLFNDGLYTYRYTPQPKELAKAQKEFSQLLMPEIVTQAANDKTTIFTWDATKVFAKLQAARLIVYPLNDKYFPVRPNNLKVTTQPEVKMTASEQGSEYFYLDFTSEQAGKATVSVYLDNILVNQQKIEFIADCSQANKPCRGNLFAYFQYYLTKLKMRLTQIK